MFRNAATLAESPFAGHQVAASQLIAFPEHKLMFKGEKMEEGKTLSDYGIQESMGFFGTCESCPFMSFLAEG